MREEYQLHEPDAEYINRVMSLDRIRLAIVGQDPYPNGATSIPFVKTEWGQLSVVSAGHNVFRSALGADQMRQCKDPRAAAFMLLDEGIVLLNASYFYLEERSKKCIILPFLRKSLDINLPVLQRSEYTLLCGDKTAEFMQRVIEFDQGSFEAIPHPCKQSRNARRNKEEWDGWWEDGRIRQWMMRR